MPTNGRASPHIVLHYDSRLTTNANLHNTCNYVTCFLASSSALRATAARTAAPSCKRAGVRTPIRVTATADAHQYHSPSIYGQSSADPIAVSASAPSSTSRPPHPYSTATGASPASPTQPPAGPLGPAWRPAALPGVLSARFNSSQPHPSWRVWLSRLAQLSQYRLMLLFQLPAWGKLLALVMVGLPILLVGAALLHAATQLPLQDTLQHAFFVLQNVPGADITRFTQPAARVVLVAIHLVSVYSFATLVGLLTEDVRATVERIRSGNFPLPVRGHTILLDGGADPGRLISTLGQILAAREAGGRGSAYPGSIAVLSPQPKNQLDALIADTLPQAAGRVATRSGSTIKVLDLQRVAAAQAATVVLLAAQRPTGHASPALHQELCLTALRALHHGGGDDDPHPHHHRHHHHRHHLHQHQRPPPPQQQVTRWGWLWPGAQPRSGWTTPADRPQRREATDAAAVQHHHHHHHHHHRRRRQRVVVESAAAVAGSGLWGPGPGVGVGGTGLGGATAGWSAESGDLENPLEVTYVCSTSSTCRVAVQCAVQPGLAAVFDALVCRPDDAAFQLMELPEEMEGLSFAEARRRFPRAVLCGLLPRTSPPSQLPDGTTTAAAATAATGVAAATAAATPSDASTPVSYHHHTTVTTVINNNTSTSTSDSSSESSDTEFHDHSPGCQNNEESGSIPTSTFSRSTLSSTPYSGAASCGSGDNTARSNSNTSSGDASLPAPPGGGGNGGGGPAVLFCPPDELTLLCGDTLVLLVGAGDSEAITWMQQNVAPPPPPPLCALPYDGRRALPSRLLVLAADSRLPNELLEALQEFAGHECEVTVLSREPCRGLPLPPGTPSSSSSSSSSSSLFSASSGLVFHNVVGELLSADGGPLLQANVGAADAVILTGTEAMSADEADGLVLGTALLLQQLLLVPPPQPLEPGLQTKQLHHQQLNEQQQQQQTQGASPPPRPLTFVCSLREPHNRTVLQHVAATACRTAAAAAEAASAARDIAAGQAAGHGGGWGTCSGRPGATPPRGLSVEVVEPEALIGGLLAQVGAQPKLYGALADLLDEQGCEVYLKRPARYRLNTDGCSVSWAQVSEVVRNSGDVALGYLQPVGRLHLAPSADSSLVLGSGDKLVVLSEAFC